jgi:hypothetical protein
MLRKSGRMADIGARRADENSLQQFEHRGAV